MIGLRTVIYKVPNINDAKKWYSHAFYTDPYFEDAFYIGFNIGGYELGLQSEETQDKSSNIITYWGVNDIYKEYNKLLDLGATSHEKPKNVGGEIMIASVRDPWKNILGIIYNPEFKPSTL